MLAVSSWHTESKCRRENGKNMKKGKRFKKALKLSAGAGVREGVKAAGGRYGSSSKEPRVNIIYLCQLPARPPCDCGMEPVACDCSIFDKCNLECNFYFSVAASEEEWGWLLLLSVTTSGNSKKRLTG